MVDKCHLFFLVNKAGQNMPLYHGKTKLPTSWVQPRASGKKVQKRVWTADQRKFLLLEPLEWYIYLADYFMDEQLDMISSEELWM